MSLTKVVWYVLRVKNRHPVSPSDQWDCCRRGEAEVRILNFKIKWSELQKPSKTATERGEAELRILNFKTTWSEFQMPSQTATAEAKPRCVYSISKPHGQNFRRQIRLLPREFQTKP